MLRLTKTDESTFRLTAHNTAHTNYTHSVAQLTHVKKDTAACGSVPSVTGRYPHICLTQIAQHVKRQTGGLSCSQNHRASFKSTVFLQNSEAVRQATRYVVD